MSKWGILENKWWGKKFVEYSPERNLVWINSSSECIGCNIADINFDIDYVTDFLVSKEGRYCWGTYLPREIIEKLKEKVPADDEWLIEQLNFLERQLNYTPNYSNKKKQNAPA